MPGENGTDFVTLSPAAPASPPPAAASPPPPPAPTPAAPTGAGNPAPAATPGAAGVQGAAGVNTPVQPQPAYTIPPEFLSRQQQLERELDQHRRQVAELSPHAQQWQAHQQAIQQKAQAEAAQKQKNLFGLDYRGDLRQWVQVNPQTNQYEALPGAPANAVNDFARQERALADVAREFFANPTKYLDDYFGTRAETVAQKIATQQIQQLQDQNYTQQFLSENRGWMVDPATNRLSQAGQAFQQHVTRLQNLGIRDSKALAEEAYRATYLDVQMRQQQRQPAAQPQLDPQAALLATAQGVVPATPVVPASPPPAPVPDNMSLDQRLKMAFAAHGITDADIRTHGHA